MADTGPLTEAEIALFNRQAREARAIEDADWMVELDELCFDLKTLRTVTLREVREAE